MHPASYLLLIWLHVLMMIPLVRWPEAMGRGARRVLIAGQLVSIVSMIGYFPISFNGPGDWAHSLLAAHFQQVLFVVAGLSGLGALLFATGFAGYGLGMAGLERRRRELESVIAAKQRELESFGERMASAEDTRHSPTLSP